MLSPAESTATGAQALLDLIKRQGLIPAFKTGTVHADATASGRIMIVLDGDVKPTPAYNYAGPLMSGTRVLAVTVRPHALYVVGDAEVPPNSVLEFVNKAGPVATDTTTSAAYANMTDTTSVSFTKNRADTVLVVDMRMSCFLTGVGNTRPSFAVQIASTDYEIVSMLVNPTSTHTTMAGLRKLRGIAAGTYTVQGRWLRAAGTGTISRNADDWVAISVFEAF